MKYVLTNKKGSSVALSNIGARILSFIVKDKSNNPFDIICGYDTIDEYFTAEDQFLGAIVGRCANRIANSRFYLDGKKIKLSKNKGKHHLHGGNGGFHSKYWDSVKLLTNKKEEAVLFEYFSNAGEEGYPSSLKVEVIYTLTNNDELIVEISAISSDQTIVNLASHPYFNLHGTTSKSPLSHQLLINSVYILETDAEQICNGNIISVENTPFDFTSFKEIGKEIDSNFLPMIYGAGYDHCFLLNKPYRKFCLAAELYEPSNGIKLQILTNQPGLQLYTANFWSGKQKGKNGDTLARRTGIALEAQHFPNSPNIKAFPTVTLQKGEVYNQKTVYKISS